MTSILLRNISFHARRIHLSHYSLKSSNPPSLLTFFKPTSFFSSRSDPPPPPFSHINEKNKNQQSLDIEEISNEELKRRVARLKEGDEEAIPAVFEAVLQRYLTGKPIDADQDLMREILGKGTESENDEEEDEFGSDSDLEGMSDSDFEEEEDFNVRPRIRAKEEKPDMK
ncbi:Ribosomal protein S24/S35 [Trifolium repens]|nr:Ribosomal protein S24/S35 [Trifolium repens]